MSRQKMRIPFFLTERGRSIALGGVITFGAGLFGIHYLPNTICVDYYKEFVQAYRDGKEREVPEAIKRRYERAIDVLEVSEFEKRFLKPFLVYGFDMFSIGSSGSNFGGLVGIPTNYEYNTAQDIQKKGIGIRGKEIDWDSSEGKILEQALVINEEEQVFGIAREILQLQTSKVLLNSIYPCSSLLFVYTIGNQINNRFNFYARPASLRLVLYSILSLFGYGLYTFFTDYTQVHYDLEADRRLASLGQDFIAAGCRFYDKLLKKNIAIRNLTGDTSYTALGNENFLLRQKSLPLTVRKAYFESKLKEAQASSPTVTAEIQ